MGGCQEVILLRYFLFQSPPAPAVYVLLVIRSSALHVGAWFRLKGDYAKLTPSEGISAPAGSDTGQFRSDTTRQIAIFVLLPPYFF